MSSSHQHYEYESVSDRHAKQPAVSVVSSIVERFPFLGTRKGAAALAAVVFLVVGGGLAGLAALPKNSGSSPKGKLRAADVITEDTYFYGQSPPVYPSPEMTGGDGWEDAYKKAKEMVGNMTNEEKLVLTAGKPESVRRCDGNIAPISKVGFPGMCLADAGNGLRGTDFVTAWPSGVHVGASFNRQLSAKRAYGMGSEFRKKGVNVLLGPVVGPIGRTVRGGRNWEGFTVDPYLSGILVDQTVRGIQNAGVIASTKHYIANEQETNRQPDGDVQSVSSNIDDRTMHELYLWPFMDAVRAGTGSIMCSYNRLNNSYGCANSKALNGLLKTELGFQGHVVSDWWAQHSGVSSALAGLDVAMPQADSFWGPELLKAINNGTVPQSRLDDMAIRVLAPWFQLGHDKGFPTPGIGLPADINQPHQVVDARNSSDKGTIFDGAVEGHVLVKNIRNALPLTKPKMLTIYGYSAKKADKTNFEPGLFPQWVWGPESMNYDDIKTGMLNAGEMLPGTKRAEQTRPIAINGTIFSGGGSGAVSTSLVSAPFDAISQQCWEDDTVMFWDFASPKPAVNSNSEACLVFGNAAASEGWDRVGLRDDYTDGLIKHVANSCNNTIVILHNAGPRLVDQFIDHPNVTALIYAHLPGQASGVALASILYGKVSPSGKMPYTVARNETDYGGVQDPNLPEGKYELFPQADFTEGLFLDYRHFDNNKIEPRYEFGFGLSYTTFGYANLKIEKSSGVSFGPHPEGPVLSGGPASLWETLVRVTAEVENTGSVDGAEVAQLYLSVPGAEDGHTPLRVLRGFEKPFIRANEKATVQFELSRRDVSVWDVITQKWLLRNGTYTISVGSSSRILPINGTFSV
ncbi:hypothetical protein MCOR25_000300 [Pyricularia grisea]|nr:hypothetical protein MCOR25_000300 [Pyricularia grisea]